MLRIIFVTNSLVNLRLKYLNLPVFIRQTYGDECSKLFWKYGSTNLKILKANLDIEYLKKCKIFNVIPKFLRFKLYKRSLHSAKFYKSWQSKLLLKEISSRKLAAKRLTLEQHDLEEKLRNQLSSFNLSMVFRFFRKQNSLKCDNIKEIRQRKLQSLGVSNDLAPCNPDNVIFKFSLETLSPRLRTIMAFGLDFCLPVWKLDFYNYFARFEKMFHDISREVNGEKLPEFKSKFQTIVCKYFYNFKAY